MPWNCTPTAGPGTAADAADAAAIAPAVTRIDATSARISDTANVRTWIPALFPAVCMIAPVVVGPYG